MLPAVATLLVAEGRELASTSAVLDLLGRVTGIAGLALMLVAEFLSCGVPGFDRPFGGLTKLWKTRHQLATAAFLLLLAHPLLPAFAAAPAGVHAMAETLFPSGVDAYLSTGWGAHLLLMVFLAPGYRFFGSLHYQRWKSLHGLAAPAVLLALLHTFGLARTLPRAWEMLLFSVLAALALVSIGYRFFWSRRYGRRPYRVLRMERPANNLGSSNSRPSGRRFATRRVSSST